MKAKTFGEAVKRIQILFSILGVDYWFIFITDVARNPDLSIHHGENSKIETYPGMGFEAQTALIVSDPIELFITREHFIFKI